MKNLIPIAFFILFLSCGSNSNLAVVNKETSTLPLVEKYANEITEKQLNLIMKTLV